MKKEYAGWVAAGVVAVVLGSLLGWQFLEDDDGGRRLAALDAPANIPPEVQEVLDRKQADGRNPKAPPGKEPPRVGATDRQCNADDPPNVQIFWRNRPENVGQLRQKVSSVVLAEVLGVEAGEDIVIEAPGEPGGEDRTQTQEVRLRVVENFRGQNRPGATIRLTKLGGPCFRPTDDPAYQPGQRYLLGLEQAQQAGAFRTAAPEGRFAVDADGTLHPAAIDSPVANEIARMKVAEAGRELGRG